MDKRGLLADPPPPLLVHVVVEWPLSIVIRVYLIWWIACIFWKLNFWLDDKIFKPAISQIFFRKNKAEKFFLKKLWAYEAVQLTCSLKISKCNLPEQMFSVPWGPEKVHNMSFLISTSIELKVSKHVMLSIMFNST